MNSEQIGLGVIEDGQRPNRVQLMMEIARLVALRGTCQRLHVGALITNREMTRIESYGYNGNFRGGPHVCDRNEAGRCGCLHAEENALIKAPYAPGELTLFTTTAPCLACAKRILNAGIKSVFFLDGYRSATGVKLLLDQRVSVVAVIANRASLGEVVERAHQLSQPQPPDPEGDSANGWGVES